MELWSAKLTKDMVEGIDEAVVEELVDALNDVVAEICQEYGVA